MDFFFFFPRTFHGQEERDRLPTAAPCPGRWSAGRAERARGASARVPAHGATRAGGDTRQRRQKPGELPPLSICWKGSRSSSELLFQEADMLLKILESYFQSRKWWAPASGPVPGRLFSAGFGSTQFNGHDCNLLPRLYVPLLINVLTFICLMTYVELFIWNKTNYLHCSDFGWYIDIFTLVSAVWNKNTLTILSFLFPPAIFFTIRLYKFKHRQLI